MFETSLDMGGLSIAVSGGTRLGSLGANCNDRSKTYLGTPSDRVKLLCLQCDWSWGEQGSLKNQMLSHEVI